MKPFVAIEAGGYGWRRVAGGGSAALGEGRLTIVGQWKTYDGPWQLPQDLHHYAARAKFEQPTALGTLSLSLSGYSADDWHATLYGQYYDWHMLSISTYAFQINQFDRRWILGGRYERDFRLGDALSLTAGAEFRHDKVGNVGVEHTDDGVFAGPIGRDRVTESSGGLYLESAWSVTDRLRLNAGLRGDRYRHDVETRLATGEDGNGHKSLVSPKLGLTYRVGEHIEVYGSWGRGFHSNDVRGVVRRDAPTRL